MTIPLPQEKLLSLLTNASVFHKASRGTQDTRCRIMGQPPSPSVFLALLAGKQQKTCPNKPKWPLRPVKHIGHHATEISCRHGRSPAAPSSSSLPAMSWSWVRCAQPRITASVPSCRKSLPGSEYKMVRVQAGRFPVSGGLVTSLKILPYLQYVYFCINL